MKKSYFKGIFCIITLLSSQLCDAQCISVVKVEEVVSGSDAFNAPLGRNGKPCGLVKVKTIFPDLVFKGVIGKVARKTNEYLVYIEQGATEMTIIRHNILPVVIHFEEYGIEEIISKATYSVVLKEIRMNSQKDILRISVKPYYAKVYVDNILINNEGNSGQYELFLSKGDHVCRVDATGYSSYSSVIKTGREATTLSVELESLFAEIDVNSKTPNAVIIIDGEKKGMGSWHGRLAAGNHVIEVCKEGFISKKQNVLLLEREERSILIPALQRKVCSVDIKTEPTDCCILVDGHEVAEFPLKIQTGTHTVLVKAFGCSSKQDKVEIDESQDNKILSYNLVYNNELYAKAYHGDLGSMVNLANSCATSWNNPNIEEARFWLNKIIHNKNANTIEFLNRRFDPVKDGNTYSFEMEKYYCVLFWLYTYGSIRDYKNAVEIIKKVLPLEHEFSARLCFDIGSCYLKLDDKEQAVSWFRKCIQRDKRDGIASLTEECENILKRISK